MIGWKAQCGEGTRARGYSEIGVTRSIFDASVAVQHASMLTIIALNRKDAREGGIRRQVWMNKEKKLWCKITGTT